MEKRRQPEIIAGRVNADGSIAAGDGFAVTKTGTGLYTITFAGSFRVVSMAVTSSVSATGRGIDWFPVAGGNGATVQAWSTSTAALLDAAFGFVAVGVQQ